MHGREFIPENNYSLWRHEYEKIDTRNRRYFFEVSRRFVLQVTRLRTQIESVKIKQQKINK